MQKHKGVAILIFSFNMQVLQSPAQPTSYRVMNNQMHKKITLEGYVNASAALKKIAFFWKFTNSITPQYDVISARKK